jgi:isoleucyl-tRNA synthetase
MGVDVMRWMYCNHKPENNLLFGYHRADEARRAFLLPIWNVYSFFVTYAKLDGWTPDFSDFDPNHPEGKTPASDNPLDKWILARLNQVVARVDAALADTDAFAATLAIEPLIDDLTNWYVRRSRRRFWRSEQDADKGAAYATLYHVLVKLVRLLAPITPFVTEEIYQNLVVAHTDKAHASVHHTIYPQSDQKAVDETLITEMDLARRIASLGLSARGNAGLKVRQPLSKVLVHVSEGTSQLADYLTEIVTDELNVKALNFVTKPDDLVTFSLQPDNRTLGPRFGSDFPKLRAVLEGMDAAAVKAAVEAGETVTVKIGKQEHELAPDEILVNSQPAEGLAVAAEKGVTVAIDAAITPELRAEGLAREVVRRIQDLRKQADFNIEDRITTYYQADGDLAAVFTDWADYIQAETLSEALVAGVAPESTHSEDMQIEGETLTLTVERKS